MSNDNNYEFVYIFTNPAIPDYVKVGITYDIDQRLKDLSSKTSVPLNYECYAYLQVPADGSARKIEAYLHKVLAKSINKTKEFFKASPEEVLDFFEGCYLPGAKLFVINRPQQDTVQKSIPTTFEMLNIPVGAVLSFKEDLSIKCVVLDSNNKVDFNGKTTTLSAVAKHLKKSSVSGYCFFVYEQDSKKETLAERRKRLEK